MGGQVLELFGKEDQEAMFNRLTEVILEETKMPTNTKSTDELRDLFLQVRSMGYKGLEKKGVK